MLPVISCYSNSLCGAAGSFPTNTVPAGSIASSTPFVDSLSNGVWSITVLPNPPGTYATTITAISCPSANWCVAVGNASSNPSGLGTSPVIDVLEGNTWSVESAVLPSGTELHGLWCNAQQWCVAVGTVKPAQGPTEGVVDMLSSGTWTPTVLPGDGYSLDGVASSSAPICAAVGSAGGMGLVESLTGAAPWTPTTIPGAQSLQAVSCLAGCFAVGNGNQGTTGGGPVAAVQSNGASNGPWTTATLPVPGGVSNPYLLAVSCYFAFDASVNPYPACNAVGYAVKDGTGKYVSLVESLSGSVWR